MGNTQYTGNYDTVTWDYSAPYQGDGYFSPDDLVSPFTPQNITTLRWYDGFDIASLTLDNNTVEQFNDKSGNDGHISQSDASRKPAYANNTITFDGVNDYLFNNSPCMWDNPNGVHVFALVSAPLDGGVSQRLLAEGSSSSTTPIYSLMMRDSIVAEQNLISQNIRNDVGSNLVTQADNTNSSNAWDGNFKVVEHIDSLTQMKTVINAVDGDTPQSYTRSGTLSLDRFSIGALLRDTPLQYMQASLKEMIIIDAGQSTSLIEKIQGYLAHRGGIQSDLPEAHPYRTEFPNN